MMTSVELHALKRALKATFPLIGPWRRRRAIEALFAHRNDPAATPLLLDSILAADPLVAERARSALADVTVQQVIDAICQRWSEFRDARLSQIILDREYIAQQPRETRILTALKCGKRVGSDRPNIVAYFVKLLEDTDQTIRVGAERCLEAVSPGAPQDALCDLAIQAPNGPAAKICLRTKKRPSDPERACLFLFVTGQLDEYFVEDFKFQNLRLQYERADATVKSHVMNVIRSGDRRCAGFIGTESKPLTQCSDSEIQLALNSWQRHQEWPRLFQASLTLPLRFSWPLLSPLRASRWTPDEPDLQSVFRQMLADAGNETQAPPTKTPNGTSSAFDRWLAQASAATWNKLDEATLLQRLASATPPEGVAIVAALAKQSKPTSAAVQAVATHKHWLVRLAGHSSGLRQNTIDLTRDAVSDFNYWITELASSTSVLDFWPARAKPSDLAQLNSAPAEAWSGQLGQARRVLRTILAYRNTDIVVEDVVVRPDEFSVVVDDDDE